MDSSPVAVIDVGSNTIKLLVAVISQDRLTERFSKTLDARMGSGIGSQGHRLGVDCMDRGIQAIQMLVKEAQAFRPSTLSIVATSAVRDAANGSEFAQKIQAQTGLNLRILAGEDEADLIGRGLLCDPGLHQLRDFYLFDLGGGSLECLSFRDRKLQQALSLPLGCVRLTETYVTDPLGPVSASILAAISEYVKLSLRSAGFQFSLPPDAVTIATGGTAATVRAIFAERSSLRFADSNPVVSIDSVSALLDQCSQLDLEGRKKLPGLPAARADIFPTALAILRAIAELASAHELRHSAYNLRWGVAAELAGFKFV